jgi:peptide/nickel transport system permease protein
LAAYLLRRLLYALLTFIGITIATFALIHSVPGDPITFFLGKSGRHGLSSAAIAHIRAEYHLDQPLPVQYLYWARGIVTLDFGRSILDHRPVTERILEKLPNTFEINLLAFLIAAAIGVPVGLWSATRAGRLSERASAMVFFLLYSLPPFWVALMLIQLFAMRLQVLPLFGMGDTDAPSLADHMRHLILPVITLTYSQLAVFVRFSKSAVTEVIRQDFITAARAKGAGEGAVLWQHAFRNALIPLITLLGLTIPYLISGSVIVEQIFQWDGIGLLYLTAIVTRDYPTVMGLTVVTAMITLFASVLADVLYGIADPRIRLGDKRR